MPSVSDWLERKARLAAPLRPHKFELVEEKGLRFWECINACGTRFFKLENVVLGCYRPCAGTKGDGE